MQFRISPLALCAIGMLVSSRGVEHSDALHLISINNNSQSTNPSTASAPVTIDTIPEKNMSGTFTLFENATDDKQKWKPVADIYSGSLKANEPKTLSYNSPLDPNKSYCIRTKSDKDGSVIYSARFGADKETGSFTQMPGLGETGEVGPDGEKLVFADEDDKNKKTKNSAGATFKFAMLISIIVGIIAVN